MEAGATNFHALRIEDWRQFHALEVEFDPRLTILTGANASGKSTVLGILATHFNWSRSYITAPSHRRGRLWSPFRRRRMDQEPRSNLVGELSYSNGAKTELAVPLEETSTRSQYDVQMPNRQAVTGVFLTSHRAVSGNYAEVATIPALFGSAEQLFEQFTESVRVRWQGSWTGKTPQMTLKESLIAAAVFGEGSASVDRNEDALAIWEGFQDVLKDVLPKSLSFQRLRVRMPDVVVETGSGDFILDEASGGLSAILEIVWQIFLRSRHKPQFTVLIDEPENHLHPSLQREIVPSLMSGFPDVQFIVATHSPLVVTATPDSSVYVFDYNSESRVDSRPLDYVNKAASADDTLRRVLGLVSTTPVWAEERFRHILDEHLSATMSSSDLRKLRQVLEENGLESRFPEAVISASESAGGESSTDAASD